MRTGTLLLSALFTGGILLLAVAAGWRAAPVHIPASADLITGKLAKEIESHYDAVFPAKTLGINVWAAIDYVLFREGRPGVVVGEQDWLYTDEEFRTYPDAETQIAMHLDMVPAVRDALARHGSRLVVAVLPAKARVYPEFLGRQRPAALHVGLYDRALAAVRRHEVLAPDLLAAMIQCKPRQAAFLRTDTHWTAAGARCVARQIGQEVLAAGLAAPAAQAYRTRVEAHDVHRGDLVKFLPLDPYFDVLLPPGDPIEVHRTETAAGATPAGGLDLLDEVPRPEVVLVGTSYSADTRWNFAGALQEALGEDVVSYANPAQGPFQPMREYLESPDLPAAPPRLVIWEVPERYFPKADHFDTRGPTTAPGGDEP